MTDVDFTTLMTTEEVAQARRGGEIVRQHRTGEKLRQQFEEAFAVGHGLLIGRATAMRAANASEPRGRPYVEAFSKWKKDFGYNRTGDMSTAYFSDCIVVASHRELAEQIIAGTSEDERFGFGLSMLAKQTRQRVKDLENAKRRKEDERRAPAAPKSQPQAKAAAAHKVAPPSDDNESIDHGKPQEPGPLYPAKAVPDPDGNESGDDGYNPLDPYDYGSYAENLSQTVWRSGLACNYRDTKLFIHNRAKAVAWFERMLADYDAMH